MMGTVMDSQKSTAAASSSTVNENENAFVSMSELATNSAQVSGNNSTATTPSHSTTTAGNPFYKGSNALIGLFPKVPNPSFPPSPSPSFSPSLANSQSDTFDDPILDSAGGGGPGSGSSLWRIPGADRTLFNALRQFTRRYAGKPSRAELLREFRKKNETSSDPVLRRASVEQIDRRIKKYVTGGMTKSPEKKRSATDMASPSVAKDAYFAFKAIEARLEYLKQNPASRSALDASTEQVVEYADRVMKDEFAAQQPTDSPPVKRRRVDHDSENWVAEQSDRLINNQNEVKDMIKSFVSSYNARNDRQSRLDQLEKRIEARMDRMEQMIVDNHSAVVQRINQLELRMDKLAANQNQNQDPSLAHPPDPDPNDILDEFA